MSQTQNPPVHASVETRDGRATLLIQGRPTAPLLYALTDCPGARWTWEEIPARNIAVFAASGCRLFQADLWLETLIQPDGSLDLGLARRQVGGVLAACPEAKVMLRLHLNPPPAWCEQHPDECVKYADTEARPEVRHGLERWIGRDNDAPVRASFSSTLWQAWARDILGRFCAEFSVTPEGAAIFALQVAYGVYGEWHQFGFFCHEPDVSPAATLAFRSWARSRYQDESALSRAWGRAGLKWSDVTPPDVSAREAGRIAMLRDPVRQRDVIDYFLFLHEGLADVVSSMARTIKESWPRPVVTATFFGYFYCAFGREAAGGHLGLERLLASPHVDCICATPAYTPTALPVGGSANPRSLVDAIRRAGKLFIEEMDRATSVCGCPWDKSFTSTLEDDRAVLKRNLLQTITRGGGSWCFDFGPITGSPAFARYGNIGWWDEPSLQATWQQLHQLATERLSRPFRRASDVLLLHDPWSFAHIASARHDPARTVFGVMPVSSVDPLSRLLTDGVVEALHRSGLIHTDALLAELPHLNLSAFRLIILATAPVLDAAQRRHIREQVARNGRHVVLLGFAGWSDDTTVGAPLAQALSGIPTRLRFQAEPVAEIDIEGTRERTALGLGLDLPAYDVPADCVAGRWSDGTPAAAWRSEPSATWWTFAVPPTSPAAWRTLGRRAGCHVINDHDDTTLLGQDLLVVHTLEGGSRKLRLPVGGVITADLPPRSTTVFDANDGRLIF